MSVSEQLPEAPAADHAVASFPTRFTAMPARAEGTATLREARDQAEHEALVAALAAHRGNISRAAEELRVSRPTLHALLEKHKVDAKQFR